MKVVFTCLKHGEFYIDLPIRRGWSVKQGRCKDISIMPNFLCPEEGCWNILGWSVEKEIKK